MSRVLDSPVLSSREEGDEALARTFHRIR